MPRASFAADAPAKAAPAKDNGKPAAPATAAPLLDPAKRGMFKVSFTERSPLSDPSQLSRRFGIGAVRKGDDYDITQQVFTVVVPKDYEPNTAYGLIVYVTDSDSGEVPRSDWPKAMESSTSIYISPHHAGKDAPPHQRLGLILDAVYNAMTHFTIDDERVYIVGIDAAAELAGGMWIALPDVFSGPIFMNGIYTPRGRELTALQSKSRVGVIIGDKSKKREAIDAAFDEHYKDKFKAVYRETVRNAGDGPPPGTSLSGTLLKIEVPLRDTSEALVATAKKLERSHKSGDAMLAYAKAAGRTVDDKIIYPAHKAIEELQKQRDEEIAEVRKHIESGQKGPAKAALNRLNARWGTWVAVDAAALEAAIDGRAALPAASGAVANKPATPATPAATTSPATPAATSADDGPGDRVAQLAAEKLAAARKQLADDLPGAYEALDRIAKRYAKTPAGAAARIEVAQLEADPAKRKVIEATLNGRRAASLLGLAKNYLRAKANDDARAKLKELTTKYPDTEAGREGKILLETLPGAPK